MKKIIILLTLAFFFLASQMGFIHALDMGTSHDHDKSAVVVKNSMTNDSLLCNNIPRTTDNKKQNDDGQECLNGIFSEAYIGNNKQSTNEFKETIETRSLYITNVSPYKISDTQFLTSLNGSSYHIDQSLNGSSYQNLIGIIKNLN